MKTLDFAAMENVQGGQGLGNLPIASVLTLVFGLLNAAIVVGTGALSTVEATILGLANSVGSAGGGLSL